MFSFKFIVIPEKGNALEKAREFDPFPSFPSGTHK